MTVFSSATSELTPLQAQQIGGAPQRIAQGLIGFVERHRLGFGDGAFLGRLGREAVGMQHALEAEILLLQLVIIEIEAAGHAKRVK